MQPHNQCFISSPLAPLDRDTVSFGSMKKREFDGIDLAVVEKFKAPIEKFNTNADLQSWAEDRANAIAAKDFGGRRPETIIQRKAIIKEWSDYILNENDAYTNTTALLILNAITKDLKPDNDKNPPVLNKGVLADCIYEIKQNTKNDPKYQFDLNKMYQNKLRAFYLDDTTTETGETATKWVIIPSKKHDPENFEANVEKLKALSNNTWCTKSNNAEPYLSEGDFHVYLENGQPKLGVRFVGDEIEEIQGERNNGRIPFGYLDVMQKHIRENDLQLGNKAEQEINSAKKVQQEIQKIKSDLKLQEAIKNNDYTTIFNYFGIATKKGKDGYLTISEYRQPSEDYTFKDIGIDENKLYELAKIKKIKESASFNDSQIRDLGCLESIGGYASFIDSQVSDLGNLKHIGGDAYFGGSQISDLGNLKHIGGDAYFGGSQISDLGYLESIGGGAYFEGSQINDLGNLRFIGGYAEFNDSQISDLGNLRFIRGNVWFSDSQVSDLGNLESIGGDADFRNSQITNLGNLKDIGGTAHFSNSQIKYLGKVDIGGDIYIEDSQLTVDEFENLKIESINFDFDDTDDSNFDFDDYYYN